MSRCTLETNFVKTLSVEIENALKEKVNSMGNDDWERYAADDSAHANDIQSLKARK